MTPDDQKTQRQAPPPLAQRVGTVNAVDRSRQYTRADNPELLRSLNEAWSKIRLLESSNARKDVELGLLHDKVRRYRVGYMTLVAIVTGVCWEGVKAMAPIALRWLGFN